MTSVESPTVAVTEEVINTLVSTGGYTHPLFQTNAENNTAGHSVPLPGQGVLLLMGGLVEQSGALDNAIAMLELRQVRFRKMLTAGSTLRVTITPLESTTTSSGKLITVYRWIGLDGDDEVAEAEAVMLMNTSAQEAGP